MIVTVAQRKAQAIDRLRAASIAATGELRTFASAHGGRYVVFGSFARGDFAPTSDFDVMVDFPGALEGGARDFADVAKDLDETRRFRHRAARSYGSFDIHKSQPSLNAARRLATGFREDVERFRKAVDPDA